jgi:hypothetical protein
VGPPTLIRHWRGKRATPRADRVVVDAAETRTFASRTAQAAVFRDEAVGLDEANNIRCSDAIVEHDILRSGPEHTAMMTETATLSRLEELPCRDCPRGDALRYQFAQSEMTDKSDRSLSGLPLTCCRIRQMAILPRE